MENKKSYRFGIITHWSEGITKYNYVIFNSKFKNIITTEEYFDFEQEATLAAIGHITLLEKSEN